MANTKDIINTAIKDSFIKFSENGLLEKEAINLWLSQSLNNLYNNHDASGFICDYQNDLESNVTSEEILDYISENYVEMISKQEDITDEFRLVIKNTLDNKGNENAKIAVKKFITDDDLSGFVDYNEEKLKRYSREGLITIMSTSLVENITNNESSIKAKKSSQLVKAKIFPYEFFVCANNTTHDISKLVEAMEAIRSGKINSVSEQEVEVDV